MNESALQRSDDCLRPVTHVEAQEDDADMAFDGGLHDAELGCNLLVALPAGNQLEHFEFARAEFRVGNA